MLNESIAMMVVASTSRSDYFEARRELCRIIRSFLKDAWAFFTILCDTLKDLL